MTAQFDSAYDRRSLTGKAPDPEERIALTSGQLLASDGFRLEYRRAANAMTSPGSSDWQCEARLDGSLVKQNGTVGVRAASIRWTVTEAGESQTSHNYETYYPSSGEAPRWLINAARSGWPHGLEPVASEASS